MTDSAPISPLLVLCRDLLFSSRISATARSLAIPVRILRDPSTLAGQSAPLALVDLNLPGAPEAAAAWKAATAAQVIAFVSHTDTPTITKARDLGIDKILARSAFVQALPDLLKRTTDTPPVSSLPLKSP